MNFYQLSRRNSRTSLRLLAIPLPLTLLSGMLQPAFAAMQTAGRSSIPDQQVDGTGNAVVRVLSYDEQSLTVEYFSGEVTSEPGLFAGKPAARRSWKATIIPPRPASRFCQCAAI